MTIVRRLTLVAALCMLAMPVLAQQPTPPPAPGETPAPAAPAEAAPPAAPVPPAEAPPPPSLPPPPAKKVDCLAVPGFPDFPGASLGSFKVDGPEFGVSRTVSKTTRVNTGLAEVKAHFQKILSGQGWQVVSYQEKPGEVDWSATKGDAAVEIELEAKAWGAVEIDVKRRDR